MAYCTRVDATAEGVTSLIREHRGNRVENCGKRFQLIFSAVVACTCVETESQCHMNPVGEK